MSLAALLLLKLAASSPGQTCRQQWGAELLLLCTALGVHLFSCVLDSSHTRTAPAALTQVLSENRPTGLLACF